MAEFGKCACGQDAIVKLQGVARCLACFKAGLTEIRGTIDAALAGVKADG